MKSKVLIVLFLFLSYLPSALAQVQGMDTPLGSGGTKIFCNTNESLTATAGVDGKLNFPSCTSRGQIFTSNSDPRTGESQSVIPVSNATDLNGVGVAPVGCAIVGSIRSTASTGTTTTAVITGIESEARAGDYFIFRGSAGAIQNVWNTVSAVTTNTLTFANAFSIATPSGATGYLCRPQIVGATLASGTNSGVSGLSVAVQQNSQDSAALGLLKLEDSAAASGDALVGVAGRVNPTLASQAADGDYTLPALGTSGLSLSTLMVDTTLGSTNTPVIREDSVAADQQAITMTGAVINGTLAGTASDGDVTYLKTNLLSALYTQDVGGISGGGTLYSKISTADNNSTNIKSSAGQVYSISACNSNAAIRYLKLYNKATAPTCGTDTPVMRVMLPASNCTSSLDLPVGGAFSLGIGICIVTGAADSDNTSTAANEQTVNITYK